MDAITNILRAIGETTRLRIVALLARGELTVSELVQILGQSQPRVSRHLKLLSEAGVIERLPEGAWMFYRLRDSDDAAARLTHEAIGSIPGDDLVARRDRERLAGVKAARADAASAYFRAVAQDWDRIRSLHLSEEQVERAMVERAGLGPFDLLVDLGTGTGRVMQVFADRVRRGLGIDLSHEMLTVARTALERAGVSHCSVRHGDLYALPVETGAADLVTIHQVLHYLDDPAAAIGEAARILRPGGSLLIVDFAPHHLEFLRVEHAHRRLGFDDAEVGRWLEASGLTLEAPAALAADDEGLTVKIWLGRRAALGRVRESAA